MTPELKKKLQQSIDSFLPIGERISHQTRCAKLGRLMALQNDSYMKYLIYNEFKRT